MVKPERIENGGLITAELLNSHADAIEELQDLPTPKDGKNGKAGNDGLSVKGITLSTKDGQVVSGEATLSDGSTIPVTVKEED